MSGEHVVIGCSGGLDSVVFARTHAPGRLRDGAQVTLACLDHGWRASAADDVAFVSALAEELGAGFATARIPPAPDRVRRVGRQAAAREVRRAWLQSLGADRILLAHHRDDDLETIAIGTLRATSGDSLEILRSASTYAPSIPRAGWAERPLLDTPRAELRAIAEQNGWTWREDPSNRDRRYLRVRLRRDVLPRLRDDERVRMLAGGRLARQELDRVQNLARRWAAEASPGTLPRESFASLEAEVAAAVLRLACTPHHRPLRRAAAASLQRDARTPGARLRDLGGGWFARTAGDVVELARTPFVLEDAATPTPSLRVVPVPASAARARIASDPAAAGRTFAVLDAASVPRPLTLVPAGSGRRMRPFGMGGRSRLVRDLLAEAGVPRPRRASWPVVLDGDGAVAWVPGVRAGDVAPLRPGSEDALLLYTDAAPEPHS